MFKLLSEIRGKNCIASIYTNTNDVEKFTAGYIEGIDRDCILINCITPFGKEDGYCLCFLDDIYKVEYNGRYEEKIKVLYDSFQSTHATMKMNVNQNVFEETLECLIKKNVLTTMFVRDDENPIYGYIRKKSERAFFLERIDTYGEPDGNISIASDLFEKLYFHTEDEIALNKLVEHKSGLKGVTGSNAQKRAV